MDENTIYRLATSKLGNKLQITMFIEELSELTQELCKDLKGEGDKKAMIEGLADIQIKINQLKIMYDCNEEFLDAKRIKLERLKQRISS